MGEVRESTENNAFSLRAYDEFSNCLENVAFGKTKGFINDLIGQCFISVWVDDTEYVEFIDYKQDSHYED